MFNSLVINFALNSDILDCCIIKIRLQKYLFSYSISIYNVQNNVLVFMYVQNCTYVYVCVKNIHNRIAHMYNALIYLYI